MNLKARHASNLIVLAFGIMGLTACNGGSSGGAGIASIAESPTSAASDGSSTAALPVSDGNAPSATPTATPTPTPTVTPTSTPTTAPKRTYEVAALVYGGSGSWSAEISSLENIMQENAISYHEVSSAELESMTAEDFARYGMIVWPGGYGGTAASSLSAAAHARIRDAVQNGGLNWIGFCAGAFVAVAPAPAAGRDVSYGIGVVNGPVLDYYYLENQGTDIAMTMASFADGSKRDLLWYGGPVTPNISGGVVAKYPNGDPMITQVHSGKGFVTLSAVHPAAPQSTRTSFGLSDTDGLDYALALQLLQSTLNSEPMKTF